MHNDWRTADMWFLSQAFLPTLMSITQVMSTLPCPVLEALSCSHWRKPWANSKKRQAGVIRLEKSFVEWTSKPWRCNSGSDIGIVSCCYLSFFFRIFSIHMKCLQHQWRFCCNNNSRIIPKVAGMRILFSYSFILYYKEGNCFLLSEVGGGDLGTGSGFPSPSGLGGEEEIKAIISLLL